MGRQANTVAAILYSAANKQADAAITAWWR